MIQTRELFQLTLSVPSVVDLGPTPKGHRRIATVTGGQFQGERLKGIVHAGPGGDWMILRSDGVLNLDVRLTLETDDHQLIFMAYQGVRHGPQEVMERLGRGESVDPKAYYFRMVPTFETSSEKYAWLNKIVCVASGKRDATGPTYQVYEVL